MLDRQLSSRPRLAVITGCMGNLGSELVRQAQCRFDYVLGMDLCPDDSKGVCEFENATIILGADGDINSPQRFESTLRTQLLKLGPKPEVFVFHAAAVVGDAPEQPIEKVMDTNFLQTVNIYRSLVRLGAQLEGSYRFVFFDTIGRRFLTENSLNYSASKAALHVFAVISSRFPSECVSNTRVFLGYDDSSTNRHISLSIIKVPTRKMVKRIIDATISGRTSVSIPLGRNALVLTLDKLSLLLSQTNTRRLHQLLKRFFVTRSSVD